MIWVCAGQGSRLGQSGRKLRLCTWCSGRPAAIQDSPARAQGPTPPSMAMGVSNFLCFRATYGLRASLY